MSILAFLEQFVRHQDVMKREIKDLVPLDDQACKVTTKKGDEWLLTCTSSYTVPKKCTKVVLGCFLDEVNAEQLEVLSDDARYRVVLFSKKGLKLGHFIPSTTKQMEKKERIRVIDQILSHASE